MRNDSIGKIKNLLCAETEKGIGTVVAVAVATAHCTPVATFTEFKPELRNFSFAKRQLFSLQRADPTTAPNQPTKTYLLKFILTMFG